jgi:hypothetical protein
MKNKILFFAAAMVMFSFAVNAANSEPSIVIISNTVETTPGSDFSLNVYANNKGNENAYNVFISIISGNQTILPVSESTDYVYTVSAGMMYNSSFAMRVDSSAAKRIYPITVRVAYKDDEEHAYTTETIVSVKVSDNKNPDVGAYFTDVKPAPYQLGSSKLSVDIANTGLEKAYSVVVKASTPAGSISRNSYFMGELDMNEYSTIDFDINFLNISEGTYPVNLDITYKNDNGAEFSKSESISINVLSLDFVLSTQAKPAPVLESLLVLLIVVFVIWRLMKRRHKKH